jgi:hypothetical protein
MRLQPSGLEYGNCECSNHTECRLYLAKPLFFGRLGYIEASAIIAGNVG